MFTRRASLIPVCMAAVVLPLSACKEIRNDYVGALVGGVTCAAVSKITGSNDRQALAAAAVCAALGYSLTRKMESDRELYATDEEFYEAELKRLAEYNQSLEAELAEAKSELEQEKLQIAELTSASTRSEAQQQKLVMLNQELQTRQQALAKQVAVAEDNRDYQKGLVIRMKETEGQASPEAQAQLEALEASVRSLAALLDEHETQTASLGAYL